MERRCFGVVNETAVEGGWADSFERAGVGYSIEVEGDVVAAGADFEADLGERKQEVRLLAVYICSLKIIIQNIVEIKFIQE